MKNFYSDKPVVAFEAVNVGMPALIDAIKSADAPKEVKEAVYIIIRNETGNGHSVVNGTNPGGVQSDSGKWPDKWDSAIAATCVMKENRTGNERGFVVFDSLENGVAFMCERIQARGLFVGGYADHIAKMHINSGNDLASAYYKEWVEGDAQYHIKDDELNEFLSMYNQAVKLFSA
jgi:hypothetical protein